MSKARALAEVCRSLFQQRGPVLHADMPEIYIEMARLTGASIADCVQTIQDLLAGRELHLA